MSDENISTEKLTAAILQLDRLISLCEEQIKTLRELRVSLLMKLYPDLDWQRDRHDSYSRPTQSWERFTATLAARRFKQATAMQQK